ncbi:hypothetical protein [Desertihabitans aurantiacus]|uniref:hypothetical protein n=1 Tax=Desertihabitans aurantiacus TaxID=2282477 RepID=UPI000DF7527F|nr:hypothetical protein [Desertihabitans aurantiacus]
MTIQPVPTTPARRSVLRALVAVVALGTALTLLACATNADADGPPPLQDPPDVVGAVDHLVRSGLPPA